VDARRFVVFASNHDQVGNRAIGDRPTRVLDDGQLAIAAALTILGPYTPMLFMGEEWGATTPFQYFTDHAEPELAEAIRTGRTEEFATHGWEEVYGSDVEVPDPQARSTFEASRLDWSEPEQERHARLLAFYRRLITLRHREADIASGVRADTAVAGSEDEEWLAMYRGPLAVVVNLADEPREIRLRGKVREVVLSWSGEPAVNRDRVTLPAHDVLVTRW